MLNQEKCKTIMLMNSFMLLFQMPHLLLCQLVFLFNYFLQFVKENIVLPPLHSFKKAFKNMQSASKHTILESQSIPRHSGEWKAFRRNENDNFQKDVPS